MDHTGSLIDKVTAIQSSCSPLGVEVKLIKRKDKYYIKLMCDVEKSSEWILHWGGFAAFAKYQIRPYFSNAVSTSSGAGYATYFVGTLFDFISH